MRTKIPKVLSEWDAVRKFPAYMKPKDGLCVICRRPSKDFRFGVCVRNHK